MDHDVELKEYFVLNEMVTAFDQRLLTVKGWGVTLSLVALGLGFQNSSFGMFLVSAVSSVAFWWLEAVMKTHQMRFYRTIAGNRGQCGSEERRMQTGSILRLGSTGLGPSEASPPGKGRHARSSSAGGQEQVVQQDGVLAARDDAAWL